MATVATTHSGALRPPSATRELIQVMISSQVDREFSDGSGDTLAKIRAKIADELRSISFNAKPLFHVWLCEDEGARGQDDTAWDICMQAVAAADILVVLYSGSAGWIAKGNIGICHREFEDGKAANPTKVRLVSVKQDLFLPEVRDAQQAAADALFKRALEESNGWRKSVDTLDGAVEAAVEGVRLAVHEIVVAAKSRAGKGKNHLGQALEWSNMDFQKREDHMLAALEDALAKHGGNKGSPGRALMTCKIDFAEVALKLHAIPGAFALQEARARLGQPFIDELADLSELKSTASVGPVHLIAVQQGVTETQVRRFVGRADALVTKPGFGFFVSDDTTGCQAIFLAECRDELALLAGVDQVFAWLRLAKLEHLVAARAEARTQILGAVNQARLSILATTP
jgi:hypothetical protein